MSERYLTEWNWVNYRLTMVNKSDSVLVNPNICYFAENPRIQYCETNPSDSSCLNVPFGEYGVDSSLVAVVDYVTAGSNISVQYYFSSDYTDILFDVQGVIQSQDSLVIHFRIMKNDWSAWDCSHDYSFQTTAAVLEENYKIAVYDTNRNILWGSDPVTLMRDTANVYWYDRSSTSVISRYDGRDSAKTFVGRFWMLKEQSLSFEERNYLKRAGVKLFETSRYQNKGLHLLKALVPIDKKTLNDSLKGFYNAAVVDDTTNLTLAYSPEDEDKTSLGLFIECWPDLSTEMCEHVVVNCGGGGTYMDRGAILTELPRDSVQCLEKHRDVRFLQVRRPEPLANDIGRQMTNINDLQNSFKWLQALQTMQVTTDWLHDVDYTGEGIIVGVYDTGVDFTHPAFLEKDSTGLEVERKAMGFSDIRTIANGGIGVDSAGDGYHGTHVAGIIGGNGRMSENYGGLRYQYRGVAPKVLFLSDSMDSQNQRGHVTNHSHTLSEYLTSYYYYGPKNKALDQNIFFNWSSFSSKGDMLTKTVVFAAGNSGEDNDHGYPRGYHSVLVNAKNPIIVGAIEKSTGEKSYFSSMGPTWDGRIKPDIMAPGTDIVSSVPYQWKGDLKYYGPH